MKQFEYFIKYEYSILMGAMTGTGHGEKVILAGSAESAIEGAKQEEPRIARIIDIHKI